MTKKADSTILLAALLMLSLCLTSCEFANAQQSEPVVINADGSVTGPSSLIARDGNIYTLKGNLSGGIQVQKSYITIEGAGYTIYGASKGVDLGNGVGQDPSRILINNVTVRNLQIINCYCAISNENTNNNTFIGNYIENCDTGFWIIGSSNNTLTQNTVTNCTTGISINYGSQSNIIIENNIMSSFLVWLSPAPIVDRNYWGDYAEKFPDANEIGTSGVWDIPYNLGDIVIDNHPLTQPVTLSALSISQQGFDNLPYTSPSITVLSPAPNGVVSSEDVPLNVTVQVFGFFYHNIEKITSLNYSLDGQPEVPLNLIVPNELYPGYTVNADTVLTGLAEGAHNLTFSCETVISQLTQTVSTSFTFTMELPNETPQSYNFFTLAALGTVTALICFGAVYARKQREARKNEKN
ncbi:MAG: right-handed parallel beta-helix repeat-containing protein [Candidatus Bathyarchaeia archaeon]|jgi:parallel beta-helix repeat protein